MEQQPPKIRHSITATVSNDGPTSLAIILAKRWATDDADAFSESLGSREAVPRRLEPWRAVMSGVLLRRMCEDMRLDFWSIGIGRGGR